MAFSAIIKPTDYFNTTLYAGNGSSKTITGIPFAPSLVWIKARSAAENHVMVDTVRGANNYIMPNTTNTNDTNSEFLKSFTSDGYTLGLGDRVNKSSTNLVSWNWKAGTTGSGTTTGAGTGKAYSYSVNTTSGCSIVKYLGNGTANHTIPHHLGVKPKMIITKNLDSTITWIVGHDSIGWDHILFLDTAAAKADDVNAFNDIAPTSTVWNVGTGNGNNSNNVNYMSYCFADVQGFSKMGSYIGNGNADGTFAYLGFKPAFIMIKGNTDWNWSIYDTKRLGYNGDNKHLFADSNTTEASTYQIDILSNGFKTRTNSNQLNGNTIEYVYMAFAESPFVANSGESIPTTAR